MAKTKTVYFCTECGNETLRWQGQCTGCREWNTLVEAPAAAPAKKGGSTPAPRTGGG
ncbi:MAG: DNA repair protein RadA, partial [Gemmatimonadota bacterium]|nr:DNA repair protein RadA [Gemmatimonadota bacterium]